VYGRVEIKTVYNCGYSIAVDGILRMKLGFDKRGKGGGTCFGKYYCSQDQELADVMATIERWRGVDIPPPTREIAPQIATSQRFLGIS
jgi:hypothetical protein